MRRKSISLIAAIVLVVLVLTACTGEQAKVGAIFSTEIPEGVTVPAGATYIGSRLETFFDDYLIDTELTTATRKYYSPDKKECVMVCDEAWEGDGSCSFCFFEDGTEEAPLYKMYYIGKNASDKNGNVCYAESADCLSWTKPNLGIVDFNGSTENNILIAATKTGYSGFFVFKDANPDCAAEAKYKAVAVNTKNGKLDTYTSADGKAWTKGEKTIGKIAVSDTVTVAFYDAATKLYYAYVSNSTRKGGKDLRVMTSADFTVWNVPAPLTYEDNYSWQMYSSTVMPYYRAPHIWVSFAARYSDREWLSGEGKGLTDCAFMSSRDGFNWKRSDRAVITTGAESDVNWVLGENVPAYGMFESPGELLDQSSYLNVLIPEGYYAGKGVSLYRYQYRQDGFASFYVGYYKETIVTKPIVFEGDKLLVNFRTSGESQLCVTILDENNNPIPGYESFDFWGDNLDFQIHFPDDKPISELQGRAIKLQFVIYDGDMFGYQFVKEVVENAE